MHLQNPANRLGVLGVLCGLLVACTAASTPSPTSVPNPTAGASGAASPSAAAKGELPKPELASVKIGMAAGGEISTFAQIQASQLKLYEKYGVSVELIPLQGSGKAIGALQGGQTDLGTVDFGSNLSSQLTDVPLVTVGANATILSDDLVCQGPIKTADDVKGKRIAISTFGGTSHASALIALKALNLGPTDAQITQIGGQSARLAALEGGSIDCAIVDKNLEKDMIAKGFSITASIWKPPAESFGRSALLVRKEFLAQNPNTVLAVLAASLEGQNLIWTDVPGSAQRWSEWAQMSVDEAKAQVEDFQTVGNRSLMWKDEAFVNAQKVIAAVNPDIIDVKISDASDPSLLQKLVDIGFYEKIGNPATCVDWSPTQPC